jgi:hypothetical protein
MKRIILSAFLLLSVCLLHAQVPQYIGGPQGYQAEVFKAKKYLVAAPFADTPTIPTALKTQMIGTIVLRMPVAGDTAYWGWIGYKWIQIGDGGGGGGAVSSVYGRTGAVTALEADYSAFYPLLSGTYNNPSWLNQLAWSKITGAPTFLTYHLINGAVNVGGGAELFKDTTGNKIRMRTLTADWGLVVTQLTDNVKYAIDTSKVSTVTALRDTAAALRYLYSGESVAWGTYAQRVALSSPTNGQRFFQTNEKQGEYIYNSSGWEFIPPENVVFHYRAGFNATGIGTTVSGSGAAASLQQTKYDSVLTHYYRLETGTTSTGRAHIASMGVTGADWHGLPLDSNYLFILNGVIKIPTSQTSGENFHFRFGTGGGTASDYSYGCWFVSEFDSASAAIRIRTTSNGNVTTAYTSSLLMSDLDSQYVSFTIAANTTVAYYYINGSLIHEERTNIAAGNTNTLWTLGITKRTGNSTRFLSLRSIIAYVSRRKI